MFRTTVRADENTDVEGAVSDLRARCEAAGISAPIAGLVAAQAREILMPLVMRGKQLAAQGSQLRVTRDVKGDGYAINLVFGAGLRRTFWQKIVDTIQGR